MCRLVLAMIIIRMMIMTTAILADFRLGLNQLELILVAGGWWLLHDSSLVSTEASRLLGARGILFTSTAVTDQIELD